ncbi:hypothetical protein [Paenibacillus beijingensis]|nr:hypothetical protein [Paenibacillus beijingensis]
MYLNLLPSGKEADSMFVHGKRIGKSLYVKTRSGNWLELRMLTHDDRRF